MAEPVVTAAAIGAGASLLGGMMGSSGARHAADTQRDLGIHAFMHDTAWRLKDREWFEADRERLLQEVLRQEGVQREFAQHGIRWRVDDAKAAGLHPLFALGGAGATFTPQAIGVMGPSSGASVNAGDFGAGMRARAAEAMGRGVSEAGQNVARAIAAQESADQQALRLAQLNALAANAEKDFAIASRYRAETALLGQGSPQSFPDMGDASGYVGGRGGPIVHQGTPNVPGQSPSPRFDRIEIKPGEVTSAFSGYPAAEAGISPHWKTYRFGHDMMIDLPAGSSASEAWESLSESKILLWMVVDHNMRRYGPAWLGGFFESAPALFK